MSIRSLLNRILIHDPSGIQEARQTILREFFSRTRKIRTCKLTQQLLVRFSRNVELYASYVKLWCRSCSSFSSFIFFLLHPFISSSCLYFIREIKIKKANRTVASQYPPRHCVQMIRIIIFLGPFASLLFELTKETLYAEYFRICGLHFYWWIQLTKVRKKSFLVSSRIHVF